MDKEVRKNHSYGDFGNLATQYARARQDFPNEVFEYLWQRLETSRKQAVILDAGCGTGIATRQLAAYDCTVVGSDKDPDMVAEAQRDSLSRITYAIAATDNLPFKENYFDAVTAFSAFHWFSDANSVREIRRVLKPSGVFLAVNKNDIGGFKIGYRALLQEFIGGEIPDVKKIYNPQEALRTGKLRDIEQRVFAHQEYFSPKEALAYLQSVSLWNLVPDNKKGRARETLVRYCTKQVVDGVLIRNMQVVATLGRK